MMRKKEGKIKGKGKGKERKKSRVEEEKEGKKVMVTICFSFVCFALFCNSLHLLPLLF